MAGVNRREFLGATGALLAGSVLGRGAAAAPSETVRVGFIGVGGRGTTLLRNILNVPGVAVRAICDIDPGHLQQAQGIVAEAGQARPAAFDDWSRLLASEEIDAVVSALPCDLHARCYQDVVAAGKDLYGEKPLCITRADCDTVVAAVKKSDRIVQIGFQRRADPRFIETMKGVHDGELGELVEGRITWSNAWGPLGGWFGIRERSGDWMVEQACHNWDVMNWANRCLPVRAMGMGRSGFFKDVQPERNVYDYYSAIVQYENGVFVNLIHSWVVPNKFNDEYTRLVGTRGGIDFNSGTFSYRPGENRPDRVGHSVQGEINNTRLALAAFANSVRTRTTPVATVEHARDAVLACLLVRHAVYTRSVAEMEDLRA
ncbi:MAG: Gfo/Idh/MocA family oxidoreductase [Planctomycetes bacterium]|nr:Gfo/Idh/MocA family oxidoreductase [Planctomycetota bacterium]